MMKHHINYNNQSDLLYNKFSISDDISLDDIFLSFEKGIETYKALILLDRAYDFKKTLPYTKIIYVTSGNLNIDVNDLSTVIAKGHMILVNAHSRLIIQPINKDTSYFALIFKKSFFHTNFMKKLSVFETFYNFINFCLMGKTDNKAHILYKCNEFVVSQFLYLMLALIDQNESEQLETTLLSLFEYLSYSEKNTMLPELSTLINESIANSITKYIASNYKDINLITLSEYFNYHPNYISSLIHKETGKTFQQHLQDIKLKKSTYLLINTDMYIKDIVSDLGYTDTSYFNRLFRKVYNCTPREYRSRNNRQNKG